MARFRHWHVPLGVGAVWGVAAYFSLALREAGEGVLLLWLPSGVAVAALAGSPRSEWPRILLAIVAATFAVCAMRDIPLANATGFAVAQAIEASLCVSIGRRVLGTCRAPQNIRHLTGLFAAAMTASAVSALIAIPFRLYSGVEQDLWWFMAMTLGMLVGTPILVYARQLAGLDGDRRDALERVPPRTMALILGGVFALSWPVFAFDALPLVPIVFSALVFAVLRAGQLGAAAGVFAFALAATADGLLRGFSPVLGQDVFVSGLILQGYMLLMLATSLPLASIMLARDRLEEGLRQRNEELKGNLTILNLAKTLAGIGRWQYNCVTDEQDWSEQMLVLNGLPPELAPDPGNVRDLLPDGGDELFGKLAEHRDTRIPYSFEYLVRHPRGEERVLKLNAFNEFEGERRVAIFAVAMDVTEERSRERMLARERTNAIRAAEESRRLANTDALTNLANRRCAMARLDALLRRTRIHGTPLSVVMFDIDHFKQVNDSHGHAVGDDVLVRVAELAQRFVRADDLVGRFGGEEFVWLLPEVTIDEAARRAERLRQAICDESGEGGLPPVTISVGLAGRRGGDSADQILARADEALYAAKQGGRNRVQEAA